MLRGDSGFAGPSGVARSARLLGKSNPNVLGRGRHGHNSMEGV
jgi:hypothetical protein